MQIKKYIAPTLREAIEQVKNELGEEAIVLSTRVITSRDESKKMFEVVAGIDPAVKPVHTSQQAKASGERKPIEKDFTKELEKLREKIFSSKKENITKSTPLQEAPLLPTVPLVKKKIDSQKNQGKQAFMLENLKQTLLERDFQPSIANRIIEQINKNAQFLKPADLDSVVISIIASMLPTAGFQIEKRKQGKVVAMVGPTGVGKTTCIAKLAVISKLLHKLDVGLVSLDTYRLGALDQLKIFSEVSAIDFLVAYEASDLLKMIAKFKKKDVIFLDTAGRSQNNAKLIADTKQSLSMIDVSETILVMSATASTNNLLDAVKKFSTLNYNGLIFTKLDEAVTYGNILNVASKSNNPIKYLTNGQVIPDDIIAADSDGIAELIYTGKYN